MKRHDDLELLRDHVRVERADDDALEALARGEVTSPRVVALEERAETDLELAAIVGASRPMDEAFVTAVAERVLANAARAPSTEASPKADVARSEAKPARVLPFSRRAVLVLSPLALAAAVVLSLSWGKRAPEDALLPDFAVTTSGPEEMRGTNDSNGVLRLRGGPDATFEIVVRPARSAAHVVAYVFALGEGEPNAVDANVEIAPEGSVKIRGRARALQGARELRIVVGTANGSLTRFDDAVTHARDGRSDAHVRVLTVPLQR